MSKTKKGVCAYCHINFPVSKKQNFRMRHGKPVYCSEACALAKRGLSKLLISEIPCKRCGKVFYPTKQQYRSYLDNGKVSSSYCSDKCRYSKDYPYIDHGDYVSVRVGGKEVLLDKDTHERFYKTIYLKENKQHYISVGVFTGKKEKLSRPKFCSDW